MHVYTHTHTQAPKCAVESGGNPEQLKPGRVCFCLLSLHCQFLFLTVCVHGGVGGGVRLPAVQGLPLSYQYAEVHFLSKHGQSFWEL